MIHRAIGITSGIGSLLVGARQAGFDIVGNIEWRLYYHARDGRGWSTFTENFPGAIMKPHYEDLTHDEIQRMMSATIALGHPECGNFSQLSGVNVKTLQERRLDACDLPLFTDLVAKLKPRFFVMDDLPKSFVAYPLSKYADKLPEYDLFPEWISNWGYGNVQKHRNRMFMVGALKSERWAFVPGEADHNQTLQSVIDDLPDPRPFGGNVPNHESCAMEERAQKNLNMRYLRDAEGNPDRPTWREVGEWAKEHWARGQSMTYFANDGTIKKKPGCKVEYWDEPGRGASVMDGGSYKIHPVRFTPLTTRERARIQGFPDEFVFYGSKLNEAGEYNPDKNIHMCKQTGKAMPVQFARYVSEQVMSFVCGRRFETSGSRILKPNDDVSRAKSWYCENVGYSNQQAACSQCWLYSRCTIRQRKYQIGEPVRGGQRDLVDPGIVQGPEIQPEVSIGEQSSATAAEDRSPARTEGEKAARNGPTPGRPRKEQRLASEPRPPTEPSNRSKSRFVDLPREEEFDL